MAKLLWIMGLICLAACAQLTVAKDLAEALNNNLREQLKGYETFLSQDDGTHKADLEKLIKLTESALKADTYEAKQALVKDLPAQFSAEFNQYVSTKLQEFQVNDDIADDIQFYNTLLENAKLHDELKKTIVTLENLLKETDLKVKVEKFAALNQSFSPALVDFLKSNSLPKVNHELQNMVEFFDALLVEDNIKYAAEIKALKVQAEAGLAASNVDEKQKILYAITNPSDPALFEFLQTKFIERQ
jgi:hypothetical protein